MKGTFRDQRDALRQGLVRVLLREGLRGLLPGAALAAGVPLEHPAEVVLLQGVGHDLGGALDIGGLLLLGAAADKLLEAAVDLPDQRFRQAEEDQGFTELLGAGHGRRLRVFFLVPVC